METRKNTTANSNNNHKVGDVILKIASIILIFLAIIYIYVIITGNQPNLMPMAIGIILLIITINIASKIKIRKRQIKAINILTMLLDLVAIPFLFSHVIYSYVISIPVLMLTTKAFKLDKNNTLSKIAYIFSIVVLGVCIAFSVAGYVKYFSLL